MPERTKADAAVLAAASSALQLLYLSASPISINGEGIEYYLCARFLAHDSNAACTFADAPGYAVFLLAAGLTWLESFGLIIALQAVIGALAPVLIYATLRRASRPAALAAATLYALSGVPYSHAKLLAPDQLTMLFVLVATFGAARFLESKRARHASLAIAGTTAALLVSYDTVLLALFVALALLIRAGPKWRRMAAVALAGGAALALIMAWSVERAVLLGDPALAGSLSNNLGHELFRRIHVELGGPVRFWQCVVAWPRPPSCDDGSQPVAALIMPENGPATRALVELLGESNLSSASASQEDYRRAAALATERLGRAKGDRLLRRVAIEAMRAHPQILYMMAASTSPYFGVSFENFWYDLRFPQNGGPVFFANWSADAAEFTRFDPDDPARRNMAPELWHEYAASAAAAPGLFASAWFRFGQTMQALVRNAAGLIAIVAFPFLMRGRNRALGLFLAGSLAALLVAAAIGFGFDMPSEHVVLPVMLMTAAIAADSLVRTAVRPRLALALLARARRWLTTPNAKRHLGGWLAAFALSGLALIIYRSAPDVGVCPFTGYRDDNYMSYCHTKAYGDYEDGALYYGLEPDAVRHMRDADVMIFGSSHIQHAFSSDLPADYFRARGAKMYALGFGYAEGMRFPIDVLKRHPPRHARLAIVDSNGFWGTWISPTAKEVVDGSFWTVASYIGRWAAQEAQRRLCPRSYIKMAFVEAALCHPDTTALFRSITDGRWRIDHFYVDWPADRNTQELASSPLFAELEAQDLGPAPPDMVARARHFVELLGVDPGCVIVTIVPPFTPAFFEPSQARAMYQLAREMGFPVAVPQLATVETLDSQHMTPAGAAIWTAAFLRQAEPIIEHCLAPPRSAQR
ncbi:MAG TPA: glycosyltransferase family 39 protein [Alphaproteobacteria bacterium]|nr:glycosyltransferase family 39 protein [Alphaproteobacteria bacterium]